MAFDPSTLLSRTGAGDAELRTPQNGLSLAQRKLLTLLEQPQAFEEFAAGHGIDAGRLERDLAKLVALDLVAVNGETSAPEATTVVLGGLRAPSSLLRLAFIPALVVMGGIGYFVVMPMLAPKPAPAALAAPLAASGPSTIAVAAAPEPPPAAVAAVVPIVVPLQVPPAAPPSPAAHTAPPVAPTPAVASGAEPKAVRSTEPETTAEPKPLATPSDRRHEEPSRAMAAADAATPHAPARTNATPIVPASPPPTPAPSTAAAASPNGAAAAPTIVAAVTPPHGVAAAAVPANGHAADPGPAPAKPATQPSRAAASEPTKLAMAAPSAADAHPPAAVKLLPVARQDPEFPREAIVRGIANGDVKARLAIDGAGKVTSVDIVDARPARVFDRAVRDALSHWSFPAGASGRSTEVEIAFRRD
jgi:TonB family protein